MPNSHRHFYEFDCFRIDVDERVLLRDGAPVTLPPKVFETLLALVERHGHIVEKTDLIEQVWPDTVVEENNLSQCISAIRRTLGDDRRGPRYIETVPRRGYRFAGEVRDVWGEEETVSMTNTRMRLRIQEEIETGEAVLVRQSAWQRIAPRTRVAIATVSTLALVAVVLAASKVRRGSVVTDRPQIKSLAVLPLKTASSDDQFFGLSMTDQIIARFNQSLNIRARPTHSVYKYMSGVTTARDAGGELQVDAVLDGEVNRTGDRITIKTRLIRTSDGAVLWQTSGEDDLANSQVLCDAVVDQAAREVFALPASSLQRVLAKRNTAKPGAYEAYVKGRYYWNDRTAEGLHKSTLLLEQAITEDPTFALAHAALADAYAFDHLSWPKAEAAARKALELDNELGQAHATIGFVHWFWLWDWEAADREYKLAIALSPNYATAHQWYASYLASRYYLLEARDEIRRALELDPFSLSINADLAQVLYLMGDPDAAIAQCQRTLALDPHFVNAHIYLHQAYTLKERYDEAVAEYFTVQSILNGNPSFYPQHEQALRAAYAAGGIRGFWRAKLTIEDPFPKRLQDNYLRAEFHALLGEKEEAIDALTVAMERRAPMMVFARVNPVFKGLFDHPRFLNLMVRLDRWAQRAALERTHPVCAWVRTPPACRSTSPAV